MNPIILIHGAITESKFVYIQEGMSYWNESNKKAIVKSLKWDTDRIKCIFILPRISKIL